LPRSPGRNRAGDLAPRAVLVQDPYDEGTYHRAENAATLILQRRLDRYVNVARRLGATSVTMIREVEVRSASQRKASAHVSAPSAVDISLERKQAAAMTQSLNQRLRTTHLGGPADPVEALAYARRERVETDEEVVRLLGMFDGVNPPTSFEMVVSSRLEWLTGRSVNGTVTVADYGVGALLEDAFCLGRTMSVSLELRFPS
jgi:hypothetical protein